MAHVHDRRKSGYTGSRPWRVRYRGPDGRERSKSFSTARDARQFMAEVTVDVAKGDWVDPQHGKVTFGEWSERWTNTRQGLRPATLTRDNLHIANHILPQWEHIPLARIEYMDVQEWVGDLVAKGLAPETVRRIEQLFAQAMKEAVKAGRIASSPCVDISLPAIERKEARYLEPTELVALAEAFDPRYRSFVLTGAMGGFRPGELMGFRVSSLNLLSGSLRVTNTLHDEPSGPRYGPPKTKASARTVSLPRTVLTALEPLTYGRDPADPLFRAPRGGPLRANRFRRDFWKPATVAAGLAGLTMHNLRHTAIAMWIEAGASPNEVAARAGHRSVVTVLDRYGHLFANAEQRTNDALDRIAETAITEVANSGKVIDLGA